MPPECSAPKLQVGLVEANIWAGFHPLSASSTSSGSSNNETSADASIQWGDVMICKVNLAEKFSRFTEYYSPKIVGEVNDAYVKIVKLHGEFVWHHHDNEDELFLVLKGQLRMRYLEDETERELMIGPGEFVIMPRGTEHLPSAEEEVHLLLLEPKSTLNTGNVRNERTVEELETI
jgi:mannose-6-phosphate isomerase-like protein (cupin superfamily)